jgi:membrane associated rhomboid family serine protease
MSFMQEEPTLPPPPAVEHCYRHPDEETRVHCTRCGRPICPKCMIPAPVGHQCPECVEEARREFRAGPGRSLRWSGFSITRFLIGVLVAVFVVEVAVGGPNSLLLGPTVPQLVRLGAEDPGRIAFLGQYWRFFTAMFLHIGIIHLAFNCYALWLIGQNAEHDFGPWRFVLIYLLTGFAGGVASYAFGISVSAGASGAIFGLIGAFLAFNYARRHTQIARMRVQWVWQILILNIFIAIGVHVIDWRAHLGGFIAGVVTGVILDKGRPVPGVLRVLGVVAIAAACVGLVAWRTSELRRLFP